MSLFRWRASVEVLIRLEHQLDSNISAIASRDRWKSVVDSACCRCHNQCCHSSCKFRSLGTSISQQHANIHTCLHQPAGFDKQLQHLLQCRSTTIQNAGLCMSCTLTPHPLKCKARLSGRVLCLHQAHFVTSLQRCASGCRHRHQLVGVADGVKPRHDAARQPPVALNRCDVFVEAAVGDPHQLFLL